MPRLIVLAAVVAIPAAVVFVAAYAVGTDREPVTETVCGSRAGAPQAAFLFDFRKPRAHGATAKPSALLRDVAVTLPAGAPLHVHVLSPDANTPRTLVGRLCKPYENSKLDVAAAKDATGAGRDCDDLPAQLPPSVRKGAADYCRKRDALGARLDALAAASVRDGRAAFLVEAFDQTLAELADSPARPALYVYSDMLQNAACFSHRNARADEWSFDDFETACKQSRPWFRRMAKAPPAGLQVKVIRILRPGAPEGEPRRRALEQFWRDYFAPAPVAFVARGTVAGRTSNRSDHLAPEDSAPT